MSTCLSTSHCAQPCAQREQERRRLQVPLFGLDPVHARHSLVHGGREGTSGDMGRTRIRKRLWDSRELLKAKRSSGCGARASAHRLGTSAVCVAITSPPLSGTTSHDAHMFRHHQQGSLRRPAQSCTILSRPRETPPPTATLATIMTLRLFTTTLRPTHASVPLHGMHGWASSPGPS